MTNNLLECFLYQSKLAPGVDVTCVAQIVKAARTFNESVHITGILVFDGERFCQYIEGAGYQLQALIARIARDPRHVEFAPLLHGRRETHRRFHKWSMAYALVDDAEILGDIATGTGESALARLRALIPALDSD